MNVSSRISQWSIATVSLVGLLVVPIASQAQVTPPEVVVSLAPGDSSHVEKLVQTPEIPPDPDVVVLADTTASMGGAIANVQANAGAVLAAVNAGSAGVFQCGVAQYRDIGDTPLFNVDKNLSSDAAACATAIGSWSAGGGGDTPEAQLNALWQLANGAVSWRPGSTRVIVWFGDASGHDPSNGHTEADVITSLQDAGIIVIAIPVSGADGLDSTGQATRIADATGGSVLPADPDTVSDAILAGLTNLPITVTPVPVGCSPLVVTFSPASRTVTSGDVATFEEWISVPADDSLCGVVSCTVEFRSDEGAVIGTQEITVTILDVKPPDLACPEDITTCNDPGLCSAVVDFAPTVTDNCTDPADIVVVSDPPSGSVFPHGTTTVTCTATDASGNVSECSFTITVVDCEPPVVGCAETVNPHGRKVPPAGSTTLPGPRGGRNEDGFYELVVLFENCDPIEDVELFLVDSGSGTVFGPFMTGDKIKYTESADAVPTSKKMGSSNGRAGAIEAHIIGNGDAQLFGVDTSGNVSELVDCYVPPPPK